MFLMLNLLTSTLDSSKADVTPTAQSGKYIPEEVTTPADAPKGPAPTLPPSSSQTPTRSFNPDEGKVRFGRKPKAAMVVHEKRPDLERLGPLHEDQCTPAANVHHVEKTVKEQKSEVAEKETVVQVEPDTIEGPSEREFSLENDDALQIDPETIEAPIDGRISTGTEDNGSLPPVPQTNNIYTADSTSVEVQYEGDDEASRSENDAVPDLTLGTHDIGSAVKLERGQAD